MQLLHSPSVHTELPFRVPAAHHLYSNGIAEDDNPVTIDAYKEAFAQSVTKAIAISGVMA